MIWGFHWTAWLLLFAAVVPGLTLVTVFHIKRRRTDESA